jgi:Domain of unknown function (DUF4136)
MYGLEPRKAKRLVFTFLLLVMLALPAAAKIVVDFDPAINFSKFKTFAYVGGVDSLVMLQINPDLIKDRVHRSVARELTKKGLREVQPNQNPDLVVRYWANSQTELAASANANWGPYGPFVDSYWGFWFDNITTMSTRTGSLQIDLIDPQKKVLNWRLYIVDTITNSDKVWKEADKQIAKGFDSFPPSAKEVEEKQKEREEHKPSKPANKSFQ